MNAREYANAAEMLESYAKTRARLMGTGPKPANRREKVPHHFLTLPRVRDYIRLTENIGERDLIRVMTARQLPSRILEETCKETGFTPPQLMSKTRHKPIVEARQKMYWRLHVEGGLSLTQIGRFFDKDHTTIMHGIRKYSERVEMKVAA